MAEKTIEKIEESYQMNPEENEAIQKVEDKVFYEEYAENISIQGSTQANGTSTINATGESKEKPVEENSEKSKKINYKEQTDNEQNIPKTPLDPEYKNDIDNAFDKQSNSNNFNDYPIDVDNGCENIPALKSDNQSFGSLLGPYIPQENIQKDNDPLNNFPGEQIKNNNQINGEDFQQNEEDILQNIDDRLGQEIPPVNRNRPEREISNLIENEPQTIISDDIYENMNGNDNNINWDFFGDTSLKTKDYNG